MTESNCTDFSQPVFIAVVAVRAFSGALSALSSIFVIWLIIIFKKYQLFAQRLILYLSIAALINGLTKTIHGINYPYYPDNDHTTNYCMVIGFVNQITTWMIILATVVIMVYLYIKTVHGKDLQLDVVCILTIFLFPFTFSWIPFISLTYGRAGPWCWIRKTHDDCTDDEFGIVLRYTILYGPSYAILIATTILLVVMYIVVRRRKRQLVGNYTPDKERQYKMLISEVRPLIWYPIIMTVIQIPGIVNRIVEGTYGHVYFLWFLHAFVYPLQGGFICIAYALDPDTRRRLRNCRMSVKRGDEKHKVTEYPLSTTRSDSFGSKNEIKKKAAVESYE